MANKNTFFSYHLELIEQNLYFAFTKYFPAEKEIYLHKNINSNSFSKHFHSMTARYNFKLPCIYAMKNVVISSEHLVASNYKETRKQNMLSGHFFLVLKEKQIDTGVICVHYFVIFVYLKLLCLLTEKVKKKFFFKDKYVLK